MRKLLLIVLIGCCAQFLFSQTPVQFEDYFLDQTLRVDFYQTGDTKEWQEREEPSSGQSQHTEQDHYRQ